MEEIKVVCSCDKRDFFTVNFLKDEFGLDFYDENGNIGGVLFGKEEAQKIIDYLQKYMKE